MPANGTHAPFPPASYATWREGVEAALGPDAVSRTLRTTTADGIAIEPLYAPGGPGAPEARAMAGRLVGLLPEPGEAWHIRQRFPVGTPRSVLDSAIAGGVQSLEFSFTEIAELERLADLAPQFNSAGIEVSFEGNVLASGSGVGLAGFGFDRLSLGADPVASFLEGAGATGGLVTDVGKLGSVRPLDRPGGMLVRASGDAFFDAGATSGMTLAATLAVALAYLRALETAGTDLAWAARTLEMRLPCGPRFFENTAMLRAARLVWARILEVAGIAPTPLRLVASTGRRSFIGDDPWANALRNTAVAFAAAAGGADVLHLAPHDERGDAPGAVALRLARTTGLVVRDEASLRRVIDPAEGSWFLETLTGELAEAAWEELRRIDAAGGIVPVIESGELQQRIADVAGAR